MRRRRVLVGVLATIGALIVAGAGWLGWRYARFVMDPMGVAGGLRLLYRVKVAAHVPNRSDLVRRTAETIRRRARTLNRYADAHPDGEGIEVLIPAVDRPAPIDKLRDRIERSYQLELKLVDDGSDFMQRLAAAARRRAPPGVEARAEAWKEEGNGREHTDIYLAGERPEALIAAIQVVAREEAIPADHEIALEQGPSRWRTYYLFSRSYLDNTDVKDAEQVRSETGDLTVAIALAPAATQRLAELSERSIGRKLAVLLEGHVVSAPVIASKIPNGHVRITLSKDVDEVEHRKEAEELVATFRVEALPAPVALLRQEAVAPNR